MNENKTFFIDIDGTILKYIGETEEERCGLHPETLDGSVECINHWLDCGHVIVLVTARHISTQQLTIEQLEKAGIRYHHLLCGLGNQERILINDMKPNGQKTAYAVNLVRNVGIKGLQTQY